MRGRMTADKECGSQRNQERLSIDIHGRIS
jgi:hypothetical protein